MKKPVEPLTHILPMLNWDKAKHCWTGVVCQAVRYEDGSEGIVVLDAMKGTTKDDIQFKLDMSMSERPWRKDAEELWGGSIREPEDALPH